MPTTSNPCSASSAAVTELSTPPDMATTTRQSRAGLSKPRAFIRASPAHHVARRLRQLDGEAVELLGHDDLAAEARGLRQAESEVEHVLFVLARLLQDLVPFRIDDDVAGRAGERALAGALDVDAMLVRDLQHREAERRVHLAARPVALDESHFRHEPIPSERNRLRLPRPGSRHPAPAHRPPWRPAPAPPPCPPQRRAAARFPPRVPLLRARAARRRRAHRSLPPRASPAAPAPSPPARAERA